MTNAFKAIGFLIAGLAVGLLVSASGHAPSFGGVYSQVQQNFPAITVGQSGTVVGNLVYGNCAMIVNGTIAASTTKNYDCAVTGVKAGDIVLSGNLASSTPASQGMEIIGASASTTNGFITFTVSNGTGATYNPALTQFGSSTPYIAVRATP